MPKRFFKITRDTCAIVNPLTSICFVNALTHPWGYEKLFAAISLTLLSIMTTLKKTRNPSGTTTKRDALGQIQAKRMANKYPLLDNPANLPFDQIQELLIAALRGDIQKLDTHIEALEERGLSIFDLTWNMDPFHFSVNEQNGAFVSKRNIAVLMQYAQVTDAIIYLAKRARVQAPAVFREILDACELNWALGLNGRAEAKRNWGIWTTIIAPQTEKQALDMLQDSYVDYLGGKAQETWKLSAETFLAQNCKRALESEVGAKTPHHETPGSPNAIGSPTGSVSPRL